MEESWAADSGGGVPIGDALASAGIAEAEGGSAADLRRMRAVTGSSAEECFCRARCGVASMLWRSLERLDLLGQFGNARPLFVVRLMGRCGKPGLELVTQAGQFGQVGVVEEGLAQPGLVVAKLRLGDGEVLPDADAFGAVAVGQAFQGVQDGTRSLVVPRESVCRVVAPSRYTSGGNCG